MNLVRIYRSKKWLGIDRYELHFNGLVQSPVIDDYNKTTQIFQSSLAQPISRTLHQLPLDLANFTGRRESLDGITSLLRRATATRTREKAI